MNKKGFTLVELIVVITILAILGTIAFISLQGYSKDARDSSRVSDISNLTTSLELYETQVGEYPEPSTNVDITFSGGVVWSQGTVGDSVMTNLSSMDKKPIDPLTENEYVYSRLNTKKEYQLAAVLEGSVSQNNKIINQTHALGTTLAQAYVKGNYNGVLARVSTGSVTYTLAVPSILTNDITLTDVTEIIASGSLISHGAKNLPPTYKDTDFKVDGGGLTYNPIKLVVSTGSTQSFSTIVNQVILLERLQRAYSGSQVASNNENIKKIINTVIDISIPSSEAKTLANIIVKNEINSNIETFDPRTPESYIQGCDAPDITVGSYTIAACNVGATISGTGADSYGAFLQWGRNKYFLFGDTSQQSTAIAGTIGLDAETDNYGYVWSTGLAPSRSRANTDITDNWGYTTGTNEARQGPCASGYHIPSQTDWVGIIAAGDSILWDIAGSATEGTDMMNALKMPRAGGRTWNYGGMYAQESYGYYWASSAHVALQGDYMYFRTDKIEPVTNFGYGAGLTVRCFKN